MNFAIKEIEYKSSAVLELDMKFEIASARASGNSLLVIALTNSDSAETFYKAALRILRPMKKKGFIQLFLNRNEFCDQLKTETAYVNNMYPDFASRLDMDKNFVLIKF